jgi:uncharacterized protein DUF3168
MIEAAVFSLLTGRAELAALVGDRVYPEVAPPNCGVPFITYQRLNGDRTRSLSGPSGLAESTIQIDAYALTYATAHLVGDLIRKTLDGYRGVVPGVPGDTRIGSAVLKDDRDLYDDSVQPALYRLSADFAFMHTEEP